jgi:DNA helicase II / ATP-dependent DNA helicase PcrA
LVWALSDALITPVKSTIHSAKGQEWDTVFILNLVDGCIPSDMAIGKPEQIDEERRLLYVAMTRAREHLHLVQPRRFYRIQQHRHGRGHVLAPRSRFLPDEILGLFTRVGGSPPSSTADGHPARPTPRSTSPSGFARCGAKGARERTAPTTNGSIAKR